MKTLVLALMSVLVLGVQSGAGATAVVAGTSVESTFYPRKFVTQHLGIFNGVRIRYTAIAGDTELKDGEGRLVGSIFSFSYIAHGAGYVAGRPVTFIYNGGPGSSSVWLHLGALGPKELVLDKDVNPRVTPPYDLKENPDCPLDATDLVFIDPVGTGFSRIRDRGKPEDFYGVDEDAQSIARFIDTWLTANGRWNSPKYLIGESYGAIRTAVLMNALMGGPSYGELHAISINGIVLTGADLHHSLGGSRGEDRQFVDDLPNMAATAWFHGKIDRQDRTVDQVIDEAEEFATGDYLEALYAGAWLPEDRKGQVAARLAALTGLPSSTYVKADLRVPVRTFAHELLKAENKDIGLYDSRYTLPTLPGLHADVVGDDPAMAQYTPLFTAAFHDYLANDLDVTLDEPYYVINFSTEPNWRYPSGAQGDNRSYALDLAAAMRRNPDLKILVAGGDYDLVAPLTATKYALAHAGAPRGRITFKRYPSGHMVYLGDTAAVFAREVRQFILQR